MESAAVVLMGSMWIFFAVVVIVQLVLFRALVRAHERVAVALERAHGAMVTDRPATGTVLTSPG